MEKGTVITAWKITHLSAASIREAFLIVWGEKKILFGFKTALDEVSGAERQRCQEEKKTSPFVKHVTFPPARPSPSFQWLSVMISRLKPWH